MTEDVRQAVYDAVRSRIGHVDVSSTIETVAREAFDFSWQKSRIEEAFQIVAGEMQRPCVVFRAALVFNQPAKKWWACYCDRAFGQGDTPAAAMEAFDKGWRGEQSVP